MTSETEGLGSTLLDAFACRVPVVATAAGGIPEIIHHKKTGLLAPVADAQTLARNVQELIQDTALRERIVNQAYASLSKFSKENMALKTLEIYRQVLGESL